MIQNQTAFINAIQKALGRKSPDLSRFLVKPKDTDKKLEKYKNRLKNDRTQLLTRFIDQAKLVNMVVKPLKDSKAATQAIRELVVHGTEPEWGDKKSIIAWHHPLINSLNLKAALEPEGVEVFSTKADPEPGALQRATIRQKIIDSYMGVSSADFCVAESAALMIRNRPDQPRAVSLVPSIHVAVVRMDQIIENLEEMYYRLNWDPEEQGQGLSNCMTLISGPSKTADIELVLVHGAHGPKQLIVYVLTD